MGNTRREFTPEYKDEAVKLVINTGRPPATVARELGVKEQTLGRWVNLFRERQAVGDGALSETERAELARLRKENSELKMARAFLKKASLRCEATMNDYFVFIGAEKAFFPIDWMCRKLKVARASYYRWLAPAARTEHIRSHMLDGGGRRDFTSTVPGTRFCGDITYLRTG